MRWIAITATLTAALSVLPSASADAAKRSRASASVGAPAPSASRYYPQEIEGGVTGNYAFNNQIRKLRDPLNANGGK